MSLIEGRLRELAMQGVSLDDLSAVRKAYRDKYNAQLLTKDAVRYAVRILNDTGGREGEETEVTTVYEPRAAHPEPNEFVPDALMANGNPIKEAVIRVGGQDKALELGRIIESVGGMANFSRAVAFLESLNAVPPNSPQIAPSINDDFRNLQNAKGLNPYELENKAALERVRNNMKA